MNKNIPATMIERAQSGWSRVGGDSGGRVLLGKIVGDLTV